MSGKFYDFAEQYHDFFTEDALEAAAEFRGWHDLLSITLKKIEQVAEKEKIERPLVTGIEVNEGRLELVLSRAESWQIQYLIGRLAEETPRVCRMCGFSVVPEEGGPPRGFCNLCDPATEKEEELDGAMRVVGRRKQPPALKVLKAPPMPANNKEDAHRLQPYLKLLDPVPLGTMDHACLERFREELAREFPWMESVTEEIHRQLKMRLNCGNPVIGFRPLLLTGPPGVGKTRYARRLAELLELPFSIVAVGGSSDNRALAGTARGWSTGQPSQVIQLILQRNRANPLIVLDEIDKEGTHLNNGRITDTLHQMLEPANAAYWEDQFLLTPCDLARVSWIATANDTRNLASSLLSRFRIIEVPRPCGEELLAVVHGARRELAIQLGVNPHFLPLLGETEIDFLLERCYKPRPPSPRAILRMVEKLLAHRLNAPPPKEHVH